MEIWNGTSYSQYGNDVPEEVEHIRRALPVELPAGDRHPDRAEPRLAGQRARARRRDRVPGQHAAQRHGVRRLARRARRDRTCIRPTRSACPIPDPDPEPTPDPTRTPDPSRRRPDAGPDPTPTRRRSRRRRPRRRRCRRRSRRRCRRPTRSRRPRRSSPTTRRARAACSPTRPRARTSTSTKQVLNRRGRPVDLIRDAPGPARALPPARAINLGFASAGDVRACDRHPARAAPRPGARRPDGARRAHLLAPGHGRHESPRHHHVPRPPPRLRADRQPADRAQRQRRPRPRHRAGQRVPPHPAAPDGMTLHTDIPTRSELERLLEARDPRSVSIYLPTSPLPQEAQADRIELKNLAADGVGQLEAVGAEAARRPSCARRWTTWSTTTGSGPSRRTASPCSPRPPASRTFRLPNRLTSEVEVADRFYVKPLLRATTFPQAAFVLALAAGAVRLVEVAREGRRSPSTSPGLPTDAASARRQGVDHRALADRAAAGLRGPEGAAAPVRAQGRPGAARRARRARAAAHPRRRRAARVDLPLGQQLPAPRRAPASAATRTR